MQSRAWQPNSSFVTLRWREMDSNFRFRARYGFGSGISLWPALGDPPTAAADKRAAACREPAIIALGRPCTARGTNGSITPMTKNSRQAAFVLVADLLQKSGPYREPARPVPRWAVFVVASSSRLSRFASRSQGPS